MHKLELDFRMQTEDMRVESGMLRNATPLCTCKSRHGHHARRDR